ncbi:MAG: DegT/DnrJ/EryC1/StrS family aminotransferase [Candidatus Omnitrophica bacterium]|nr:DegT/DnrJ/EryC1/StrS family aminotransferase [Candidatus Omnitrophota bacterium]
MIDIPWSKFYYDEDEKNQVLEVFETGWFSSGPKVEEFEKRMADYVGVKYAVAVSTGTAALDIALKIVGVKRDDEVIIPAMTYIATANAVCYQDATPVFADIDPKTFTIDPNVIEKLITAKTRCIIPVDYAGHAADYDRINAIARKYKLAVVEDGAPGLCGSYKGKKLCSFGDMAITSFHVAKIFSTIEGGMLFTNNEDYYKKARIIRWQGEDPKKKYYHPLIGFNYRMTDLHAAIGLAQTSPKRVAAVLESRRSGAEYYFKRLEGVSGITLPYVSADCIHPWFLFPTLVANRDQIQQFLLEKGIKANVSWPLPVYKQEAYEKYQHYVCPVTERITSSVLCLPLFFKITREDQDHVIDALLAALEKFSGLQTQKIS